LIVVGNTRQITAQAVPDADHIQYKWSSDEEAIATVDQTGLITAVSEGTTTVRVRSGSKEREIEVEVVGVTDINVVSSLILCAGDEYSITATAIPDIPGVSYNWASLNKDVATIDVNGKVTAVSTGKAEITVKAGKIEKTISVYVINITVTPTVVTILVDREQQIVATPNSADITVAPVWNSDNTGIATVDATGKVKGIAVGDTYVSVGYGQAKKKIHVYVKTVVELPKAEWTVLEVSHESADYGRGQMIDGREDNRYNYWQAESANSWAVIDMTKQYVITQIKTLRGYRYRSQSGTFGIWTFYHECDTRKVEYYVGDDSNVNGAWTLITSGTYSGSGYSQLLSEPTYRPGECEMTLSPTTLIAGQYLKLILDSHRSATSISEIWVHGYKIEEE
jgi:hypothetical protein